MALSVSMSQPIPGKLDWSPFSEDDLYKLGSVEHWDDLVRIFEPITHARFAVTDAPSQAAVDYARCVLDSSRSPERKQTAVGEVIYSEVDGDDRVLRTLLAVGANPDVGGEKMRRPSHLCCWLGRAAAASALFLCRPDMSATGYFGYCGRTPRDVANYTNEQLLPEDDKVPERQAWRPVVARLIESNKFESGFPTIAELAARKDWFAVKNLLRRQVVPPKEFKSKYSSKTASGWAEYYRERKMAEEISYYAQSVTVTVGKFAGKLLDLSFEKDGLEAEVEQLKAACAEKEAKNQELSEAIHALTSGVGGK